LIYYNIQNRIFGITTDNIINNKILVDIIQQIFSSKTTVIRIFCFVYIIQFCLNQFFDYFKTVFQNNTAETK